MQREASKVMLKFMIFRNIFLARRRKRIRSILRGHRILRQEGRDQLLVEVMAALTHQRVFPGRLDRWIIGEVDLNLEIAIRQFLLRHIRGPVSLNKSILAAIGTGGRVVHPMPPEWRQILRSHGLPVADLKSAILWWSYILMFFSYGILSVLRSFIHVFYAPFTRHSQTSAGTAHFVRLLPGCLPRPDINGRSYDILSWYSNSLNFSHSIKEITYTLNRDSANVSKVFRKTESDVPLLMWGELVPFIVWSLAAIMLSIADMARGNWGGGLMLSEFALAKRIRLANKSLIASEYLFHSSDPCYRPCWTYEAEARGSKVMMYCYSTNNEPFEQANGAIAPLHSWQIMTWPMVLVWDDWQAKFVKKACDNRVAVKVVGPIWFESGLPAAPMISKKSIAVFDVQPHREAYRAPLAMHPQYYTQKTAIEFIKDIILVADEFGFQVVLKRKRSAGPHINPQYLRTVDALMNRNNCTEVDASVSAFRVIDACSAVISMPFTSTALIGRHQDLPSIYYDPHGLLHPESIAAHGLLVLQGRDALRNWMGSLNL